MPKTLQAALEEALDQEYRSEATYEAAIAAFGPVPPFVGIVEEKRRRADMLLQVFERHGLEAVPNRWRGRIEKPSDVNAACRLAAEAEQDAVALYDRLNKTAGPADVRSVFQALRKDSRIDHLPALKRCAARPQHLDSV